MNADVDVERQLRDLAQAVKQIQANQIQKDGKKASDRFWDVSTRAGLFGVIALSATTVDHRISIARIQESKFTNKDAQSMERRIMQNLPPPWLRDNIAEIKLALKAVDARLREIERR